MSTLFISHRLSSTPRPNALHRVDFRLILGQLRSKNDRKRPKTDSKPLKTGGRFDIFNFFSARERGRGSQRPQGGGGRFFIENPRRWGDSRSGRGTGSNIVMETKAVARHAAKASWSQVDVTLLILIHDLRSPAAILFISRDTCSDSIAKLFRTCFHGVSHNYRAIRCKMGYRTDVSV